MSIWRWIDDYLEEAQESGDPRACNTFAAK